MSSVPFPSVTESRRGGRTYCVRERERRRRRTRVRISLDPVVEADEWEWEERERVRLQSGRTESDGMSSDGESDFGSFASRVNDVKERRWEPSPTPLYQGGCGLKRSPSSFTAWDSTSSVSVMGRGKGKGKGKDVVGGGLAVNDFDREITLALMAITPRSDSDNRRIRRRQAAANRGDGYGSAWSRAMREVADTFRVAIGGRRSST